MDEGPRHRAEYEALEEEFTLARALIRAVPVPG
jgi:hypothetical protein